MGVRCSPMQALVCALCWLVLAEAVVAARSDADYQLQYLNYMRKFQKVYASEHLPQRFQLFKDSLDWCDEHNKDPTHTYRVGVNQFSDQTDSEKHNYTTGLIMPQDQQSKREHLVFASSPKQSVSTVRNIDWRTKNKVGAVKDQLSCGSCYSFAATASMETAHAIAVNKDVVPLSEQMLVDCANIDGCNKGCRGGWPFACLDWAETHGQCPMSSYPYRQAKNACSANCASSAKVYPKTSVEIATGRETTDMMTAASKGVLIACIKAGVKCVENYQSGILNNPSCCTGQADHGIAIVGFGHDPKTGLDYWIIRNSWSTAWGEKGYMRLAMGQNQCSVASFCPGYVLDPANPSPTAMNVDTSSSTGGGTNTNTNNKPNSSTNSKTNNKASCTDGYGAADCKAWAAQGQCSGKNKATIGILCAKSCGLCTVKAEAGSPSSTNSSCVDTYATDMCQLFKSYDECRPSSRSYAWMSTYCKKTCGYCNTLVRLAPEDVGDSSEAAASPAASCQDFNETLCSAWAQDCESNAAYMIPHCPRTCRWCPDQPGSRLTQLMADTGAAAGSESGVALVVSAVCVLVVAVSASVWCYRRRRKAAAVARQHAIEMHVQVQKYPTPCSPSRSGPTAAEAVIPRPSLERIRA